MFQYLVVVVNLSRHTKEPMLPQITHFTGQVSAREDAQCVGRYVDISDLVLTINGQAIPVDWSRLKEINPVIHSLVKDFLIKRAKWPMDNATLTLLPG